MALPEKHVYIVNHPVSTVVNCCRPYFSNGGEGPARSIDRVKSTVERTKPGMQPIFSKAVEISVEQRKVSHSTSVSKRRKPSSKNWIINKSNNSLLDGIKNAKCRRWCRSPDMRAIFQTRSYLGFMKHIQIRRRIVMLERQI